MTKAQAEQEFKEWILPAVKAEYEGNGIWPIGTSPAIAQEVSKMTTELYPIGTKVRLHADGYPSQPASEWPRLGMVYTVVDYHRSLTDVLVIDAPGLTRYAYCWQVYRVDD